MIEKLKSLKDKVREEEVKDLKTRETASKQRKKERVKRVKSGRKLKAKTRKRT